MQVYALKPFEFQGCSSMSATVNQSRPHDSSEQSLEAAAAATVRIRRQSSTDITVTNGESGV